MNQGNEDKSPPIWGTSARIAIAVLFMITSASMAYAWCNNTTITRNMLSAQLGDSTGNSLDNYAKWGDSYGAMNALFSGIAMVAAMTAIGFQIIELGGQRHEMRMQLKEMETANTTNQERLEFDREVHKYTRNAKLLELMKEFQKEDGAIPDGLVKFALWRERRQQKGAIGIKTSEIARHYYNRNAYRIRVINDKEKFGDRSPETQAISQHINEADMVEPLMKFLGELSLLQLEPSEMRPWMEIFENFGNDIYEYAKGAATPLADAPVIWAAGVVSLIDSYEAMKSKQLL